MKNAKAVFLLAAVLAAPAAFVHASAGDANQGSSTTATKPAKKHHGHHHKKPAAATSTTTPAPKS